jgi:hypothetical protein
VIKRVIFSGNFFGKRVGHLLEVASRWALHVAARRALHVGT